MLQAADLGNTSCTSKLVGFLFFNMLGGNHCATFQGVMRAIAGFVPKLELQVTVGSILRAWAVWAVWRQAGSRMCAQGSSGLVLCFQQERWEHALVLNVSSTFSPFPGAFFK